MSAARLPWWKKHVSDWRAGTRGMSLELKGFYGECLDAQWDLQQQLPLDDKRLSMMLDCNPRSVRKLMPQLIALGKMVRTKTGYYNPRMARDILGGRELPVGGEFDPNSDQIDTEFNANSTPIQREFASKVPKNAMFSTRDLRDQRPESEEEKGRPSVQPESDAARETTVAQATSVGTDGRTPAFADLKSKFNGVTETMLAFVEAQMGGGCRPNAEQWLSSTVAAHGHEAVAQAFAAIVEKRAAGEISTRPLPHWSAMAAGMKRSQRQRSPPGRGSRPDGQVGVAELLRRRREAEKVEVKS